MKIVLLEYHLMDILLLKLMLRKLLLSVLVLVNLFFGLKLKPLLLKQEHLLLVKRVKKIQKLLLSLLILDKRRLDISDFQPNAGVG